MPDTVSDLARRLAENAEAVCRHYLSNGRRQGRYWLVGDVHNTPGRSLYVRLRGPSCGQGRRRQMDRRRHGRARRPARPDRCVPRLAQRPRPLDEARRFLGLVQGRAGPPLPGARRLAARPRGACSPWRKPIAGTLAETYLRERGIIGLQAMAARCAFIRAASTAPTPAAPTARATRGRR